MAIARSKGRRSADDLLQKTVLDACRIAESDRLRTKPFSAVDRGLESLGLRWFKLHRYWFAMVETPAGKVIVSSLFEAADMPSRM